MNLKEKLIKIYAGTLATIGFILSPISWWNDLLVNIPLSYLFAIPFGAINKALFLPSFIVGYWITNVIGLILMHHGVKRLFAKDIKKKTTKEEIRKMILISILYTLIIVSLVLIGIIKFPTEYLPNG